MLNLLKRLKRPILHREEGSVVVTAVLVMAIMIPIGLALLAIVDTQARESGAERTRDRAFNLADSALHSAAFSLGRGAWPAAAGSAPSNSGATGTSMFCGLASYGATLGAATNPGSATAKLQPNLNASYDDTSYAGAAWQINVCDNDLTSPGPTVWREDLLTTQRNFDQNGDELVWVRAQGTVDGASRVLAALVRVEETPAFSSKYGLVTGRMNSELTNTAGVVLSGSLVSGLVSGLLGSDPLVAPDPTVAVTTPPSSGVTAVRCGALDGCLAGALGGLSSSVAPLSTLIGGGKLVQTTSPTATNAATIGQLRQQAINSGTYVAETSGSSSTSNPPACTIPAAANADTVVYIEKVGSGNTGSAQGPGDQWCQVDVSTNKTYKALVIGAGRVVIRGNNTTNSGTVNTFRGLLYALNSQRAWLGDAALPAREVVRIDRGAHVIGGVAADGKSGQVGIYPPGLCTSLVVLGIDVGCTLSALTSMLGILNTYNPAITSNAAVMNAVKSYGSSRVVSGTYVDVRGERDS
jgi:Tfp pilus assembly protein PilX